LSLSLTGRGALFVLQESDMLVCFNILTQNKSFAKKRIKIQLVIFMRFILA